MTPARADHKQRLAQFYADFDAAVADRRRSCGSCFRCCVGPPLYMTCSDLEFEAALDYAKQHGRGQGLHFEPVVANRPDRRHAFRTWTCPFYSRQDGCTVYPQRPLACRGFGPFARQPIPWDECVYRESTVLCPEPEALPHWSTYQEIMQDASCARGYVFPDQIQYEHPTLELLLGLENAAAPVSRPRIPLQVGGGALP